MPSQLDLFNQEVITQAGSLNRIQKDTVNEVVRLLKLARANVQAKLKALPTDYNLWYNPQLIKSIEQMLDVWQEEAGSAAAAGQGKAYTAGQNLIDKPVEKLGIELHALAPKLDEGQLKAMITFTTGKIKDVSMDTVNRINSELALTIIGSQNPFYTIHRIQQIMEGVSKSRATCIIRTELGRAYGVAGQARLMQAIQHGVPLEKQWRRSGKIHSRRTHDLTDGQIRPADQPFIIGTGAVIPGHEGNGPRLMHPHDPTAPVGEVANCGCISLPFLAEWNENLLLEILGKKSFTEQEIALNPLKADLNYMDKLPSMEQYQKDFNR